MRQHEGATTRVSRVFDGVLAPTAAAASQAGAGAMSVPTALQGSTPVDIYNAATEVRGCHSRCCSST